MSGGKLPSPKSWMTLKTEPKLKIHGSRTASDFNHRFFIESFGVKIGFFATSPEAVSDIRKTLSIHLANTFRECEPSETIRSYYYVRHNDGFDSLYTEDESISQRTISSIVLEGLGSKLRLTIAEFAVRRVFVHSGVVGWKGKAILFPGSSFSGKTTLTAEMARLGADYYSDEYAVVDEQGWVEPFAKMLSVRGVADDHSQVEYPVESFGGRSGTQTIPVGFVFFSEFEAGAVWNPKELSPGSGLLAMIKNTIPIRHDPSFVLPVLNRVVTNSTAFESKRGDARETALKIIEFVDANL